MKSNTSGVDVEQVRAQCAQKVTDSHRQMKFGVGIGVVGTLTAAVGIVCPLCFFVAPALVGSALWDRRKARTELLNWPDGQDGALDEPR
ncbi:MAG: hypothetical protein H0U74_17360 [Bradymonadaceae bacterium]|nr:hypothetical protein [Lujinxingiaceae bacterium]